MKMKHIPAISEPISAVGFGCWATGGGDIWNNTTDQESIVTIQRAVELGINFFDVAPVYGLGHAETILGEALKGRREKVLIATKCGLVWDTAKHVTINLTEASLWQEVDASLQRLQTDYIDLYQIHWPSPNTPIAETMQALERIKESGKIRYIGVSNFSRVLTEEAMRYGTVASFQGLYNMLERNPDEYHSIPLNYRTESEILPFCQAHGLAFLPYSPIMQGLLTDSFQASGNFDQADVRKENPKLNGELFKKYFAISQKLRTFARQLGKPLSQVAINWLIKQEAVTSVITGAQTIAHIEENAASASWQLTDEMMLELEAILRPYKEEGLL